MRAGRGRAPVRLAHVRGRPLAIPPGDEKGGSPPPRALCPAAPASVVRRTPQIGGNPPRGDGHGGGGQEKRPSPPCPPLPLPLSPGPVRTSPTLRRGIGRSEPPRGSPAAGAHLGQRSRKGSGIRTTAGRNRCPIRNVGDTPQCWGGHSSNHRLNPGPWLAGGSP